MIPYYEVDGIKTPEEVFNLEKDNNKLFINKGWKAYERGYFVKNGDNGVWLKRYFSDDNNKGLFFISYENIQTIHCKDDLLWDRFKVGTLQKENNLIKDLFNNAIIMQECKNCPKNKDKEIIDFSKLLPMQKLRFAKTMADFFSIELSNIQGEILECKNKENDEGAKRMEMWLNDVNEIFVATIEFMKTANKKYKEF